MMPETHGEQGLPAPRATRLRRPSWRDPRLAIGLLLVLASTLAGGRVLAAADDTTAYYAASRQLAPGDPVRPGDLTVVRAALHTSAGYLDADRTLPPDLVALRGVAAGELIPIGAVGGRTLLTVQPVGIPVGGELPSNVRKGSRVDVWVADRLEGAQAGYGTPRRLVAGAEVAELAEPGRSLGVTGGRTVYVLLGQEQLPEVLGAIANSASISVVPATGPR